MDYMEFLEKNTWLYRDPLSGDTHPVESIPEDFQKLEKGNFYIMDSYVYKYIGTISSIDDIHEGMIANFNGYKIEPYTNESLMERFSEKNIITLEDYNREMGKSTSLDNLLEDYISNYENGNNLMLQTINMNTSSGEVFMPELKPDDDPFEKAIKSMLRYKKIILNSYKQNVDKAHVLDNLRSALSGATKNMSITKFLLWCQVLDLDWEIHLDNADDNIPHPLKEEIWISNKHDVWVSIDPPKTKGIFVVPLDQKDDPLKKLIKLALDQKRINPKEYESRSSSAHLINNMKSALKSSQKATLLYFMAWCELLDMVYEIKVTDKETGIYFQVIGYDVYTNASPSDLEDIPPIESGE